MTLNITKDEVVGDKGRWWWLVAGGWWLWHVMVGSSEAGAGWGGVG